MQKKFGSHRFDVIIEIYQNSDRDPRSLPPEDIEKLYEMIVENKDGILELNERFLELSSELTKILGWTFDTKLLALFLNARLELLRFKEFKFNGEDDVVEIVDDFLEIQGTISTSVEHLASSIGVSKKKC